jgi:hypothetical protein
MGFSKEVVSKALLTAGYDEEKALDFLLSNWLSIDHYHPIHIYLFY